MPPPDPVPEKFTDPSMQKAASAKEGPQKELGNAQAAPARPSGAASVKTAATDAIKSKDAAKTWAVKKPKTFNFWVNALHFFMKNTLTYVVLAGVVIYLLFLAPAALQKNEFYTVLRSGTANYLCLAHELGIFEERKINKSLSARANFIRFNRVTFLRDFLKDQERELHHIAAISDMNNVVYWTEMHDKEAETLSHNYNVDYGTCIAADPNRFAMPGAYRVTNN